MSDTNTKIGLRIKRLRESQNLSQAQLSKACGWSSPSRLGNYELGSRKVSVDDSICIAKALGVPASYILFGEESVAQINETPEPLTPRKKILLELFDDLPESEADALLKALEDKKRHYDELYKELSEKRQNKAS